MPNITHMPTNMFAITGGELPAFFQTEIPMMEEYLEETVSDDSCTRMSDENTIEEPIPHENIVFRDPNLNPADGVDDETITFELLDFFDNIAYDDMEQHFRSFEYGDSWTSNPIFTDEFAFSALPIAFSNIVYELNNILQIQRVVPSDWNRNDRRYSSLSESQQTRLRELIHQNPSQLNQLDDLYNRIKGYKCRTGSPQIKFLLNKTIDIVQDILRKEERTL